MDETCSLVFFSADFGGAALLWVSLPLPLSPALAHPGRNADSEGHFLSRFNDPCDFSARKKRFLRGSSTCLPRPSSPQGPAGGGGGGAGRRRRSPPLSHHRHSPPDDRRPEQRLKKWAINVQGTPPPLGYHHCHPGEQMKGWSRRGEPNGNGVDKLSASCSLG